MDIVPKIKLTHLKASFDTLALKQKLFLILCLLSFTTTILPHETYAAILPVSADGPDLIFDTTSADWQIDLTLKSRELTSQYYQAQLQAQALKHAKLTAAVQSYLHRQGSPLADFAETVVSLANWKKIVALANAESGLCEKYPIATNNCWGVGGSQLIIMGSDLREGVVAMNRFLNANPRRSKIKYSQMSFEQMNGLYKQPAAQHWVDNNQIVYDDLTDIEKSIGD